MADLSDVETALVSLISAAIYPSGPSGASAIGAACRVYRGWPNATALNTDLAAGVANVTVFPEAGGRNTTRFPRDWNETVVTAPTLTVSVAEPVVTFGGTAGLNQVAGIATLAGAWIYPCKAGDTPATVAAGIAAKIPGATASGNAVTLSPSVGVRAVTMGVASGLSEVRRQVQTIRISVWCPTPALRDTAAIAVDLALGQVPWLTLADGTGGRLIYRWTHTDDVPSKENLWRRDFRYDVEYPTTIVQQFPQMVFGGGTIGLVSDTIVKNFGDV